MNCQVCVPSGANHSRKFAHQFFWIFGRPAADHDSRARAGKTSTVLEPNLYLYPGAMLVLDQRANWPRQPPCAVRLATRCLCSIHSGVGRAHRIINALTELDPDSG